MTEKVIKQIDGNHIEQAHVSSVFHLALPVLPKDDQNENIASDTKDSKGTEHQTNKDFESYAEIIYNRHVIGDAKVIDTRFICPVQMWQATTRQITNWKPTRSCCCCHLLVWQRDQDIAI
jgi:hypothetical protein